MTWPTKKLSELLETCDAGTWGKPAPKGKGLFVLRSTNITNGGSIDFTDVAELDIRDKVEKLKLLNGDILLEKSGGGPDQPVGRVVYFMTPSSRVYTFANFIQRLRANSKFIDSHFLFYRLFFLHKIGFTKKLQSQTTGIRNLKMSLYLKTEIPIPPLSIQKQIVERLDKIAEAQKLNDELIQKTDELFQSLLHKELNPHTKKFGVGVNPAGPADAKAMASKKDWEVKKLGLVFNRITDAILPTKHPEQKFNFIGLENIESNTSHLINISPVEGRFIKSTKTRFKIGDVLYGKLRPYLNKVWLADFDGICSTDIWALRAKEGIILPQLLGAILQQSSIVQKSSASMAGANLPRANKDIFDKIAIALPPINTQKQIVSKLSAVQDYKKQLLEQKMKLKELFDSALHKSIFQS